MSEQDDFRRCCHDVSVELHQTLAQLKPSIAKKYNLNEADVENVYRLSLVTMAVAKCATMAPNMTSEEKQQLGIHVDHLIAGAVRAAVDGLSEDTTDG